MAIVEACRLFEAAKPYNFIMTFFDARLLHHAFQAIVLLVLANSSLILIGFVFIAPESSR